MKRKIIIATAYFAFAVIFVAGVFASIVRVFF